MGNSQWRLEGRDGFKLETWVVDLRFVSEEQAWQAAEQIFRDHHYAQGPYGVQLLVGPVLV